MTKRLLFTLLFAVSCSSSNDAPAAGADAAIDVAADDTTSVDDTGTPSETAPPADSMMTGDALADTATAPDMGVPFGPYPAGPYGNALGGVMPNLTWEGYVDESADAIANTKPYVASISLDQLRKKASKGYALVHVSDFT